jgi:hypothetical protein
MFTINELSRLPKYLREHVENSGERMVCGLMVYMGRGNVIFKPAINASVTPTLSSEVSVQDLDEVGQSCEVVRVVCCLDDSKYEDISYYQKLSDRDKLVYNLCFLPSNKLAVVSPDGKFDDYEGRPYILGRYDCYTLVRDYFIKTLGIYLNDYSRDPREHNRNQGMIVQHMHDEGFIRVKNNDVKPGDFLILSFEERSSGHAAVYVGEGRILHHNAPRKSCYEIYDDTLKSCTKSVWRHKKLMG